MKGKWLNIHLPCHFLWIMDGLRAADPMQNHCSTSLFFSSGSYIEPFQSPQMSWWEKNQCSEEFGVTQGNVTCLSKREREQNMLFSQYRCLLDQ